MPGEPGASVRVLEEEVPTTSRAQLESRDCGSLVNQGRVYPEGLVMVLAVTEWTGTGQSRQRCPFCQCKTANARHI